MLNTTQKMKFSLKDYFTKCDQIRRKLDLVTYTEEILNEKLYFLSSGSKGKSVQAHQE